MNNHPSKKFVIKFSEVSSASANQLVGELHDKLLKEAGETIQVSRHKEDPDALDAGGTLIVIITTTAMGVHSMGVHSPETMTEALLAALLVEFVIRAGVEIQIEDELGSLFRLVKNFPRATAETIKTQLQAFFNKDKQE